MTHGLNQVEEEVKVQLWYVISNWIWHSGLHVPPGETQWGEGEGGAASFLTYPLLCWTGRQVFPSAGAWTLNLIQYDVFFVNSNSGLI